MNLIGRKKIPVPPKQELLQSYTVSKSINITATAFKVSYETMRKWLIAYEIEIRPQGLRYQPIKVKGKPKSKESNQKRSQTMKAKYQGAKEQTLDEALKLLLNQNKVDYGDN